MNVTLPSLDALPVIRHPYADYGLDEAVRLAVATKRIRMEPEPKNLIEVRETIEDMAKRASHLWCTGMAALDVLDAAIDGRDLRQSCRLC
ncbi:hypothetical protein LNN35_21295 [Pseudomonas stutzeri]|mgnify:FL=1|jgi:hypothetical protein|uniref:hypothetical protein n=1 Tax=Gammaproteobacteria TaxID=1236 RepID=UPI001E4E2550|nr:hypothetical protein [Stutzerimonas stutzeri]MCC8345301.1 hypothetical protein [Stutzerimonas stutzeri]